jgi:V/A-type H+-transporting ATPase subunit E
MPGIDQILETILSTAHEQAEAVWAGARDRCDRIRREAEAEAERLRRDVEKAARDRCGEIERRTMTQARLERRRQRLAVKQELLDEVFARALDALRALPDDRFVPFVSRLMAGAAVTGRERVLTAAGDRRIDAALIGRANRILEARGLPGGLTLSERHADIRGGFILEDDGVISNCSFEMLLRQLRPGVEAEVARMLFGDEEE